MTQRVKDLEATIKELLAGGHDIELQGKSQKDAEDVMKVCISDPALSQKISEHDSTGVLQSFWKEQHDRMSHPDQTKRKKWNPIVLRFMFELWERMGEKHFRILGDEKVLVLPSKSTLLRFQRAISDKAESDPETYRSLREVVICECMVLVLLLLLATNIC